MRRILLLLLILFSNFLLKSQDLTGRILDARSRQPIAFANIVYGPGRGVTTDIDGYFMIDAEKKIDSISVSYVGYKTTTIEVNHKDTLRLLLEPKTYQLDEVTVKAGPNPAMRIVKNVIKNKAANDPDNYQSYSFRAYDKLIMTIHPDSLEKHKDRMDNDTSFRELKNFVEKQHFFLSESVTQTTYKKPGRKHEEVIASRSSGFKDPVFVVLISRLQSNSFYRDEINMLDKNYVSPIASRAVSRYNYRLRDTLFIKDKYDTTFIISYSPRKGKNFDGLRGMLYVSTNGWALQNVIARPGNADESGVNIKIEQKYDLIGKKYWFPVQLSTELFFGNIQANGVPFMGKGKRYVTQIAINKQKDFKLPGDIAVEVLPEAFEKGLDSLSNYRHVPISEKDKETYRVIDSVGKANNFDQIANTVMTFSEGKIPFHFLDIPLNDLLNYNAYEGFYAGLGLVTNRRFSKTFEIGGYTGYGFKDKEFKYGGHARIYLDRMRRNSLLYQYKDDLQEPASYFVERNGNVLDPSSYREFVVGRYDKVKAHSAALDLHLFRYTDAKFSMRKASHKPTYAYTFDKSPERNQFNFTEAAIEIRFAFKEQFVKTPQGLMSLGTQVPVINLRYIRGLDNMLEGQYSYSKWLLEWNHSFQSTLLGETSYKFCAGYLNRSIPYAGLFEGKGSYGQYSLYAPHSFSTMRPAEFLTDRFAAVYISHNFQQLLVENRFFSPSISIHHNMLIGDLDNRLNHREISFNVPEKGYLESGVVFANLLKTGITGLGLGFFYRYGTYGLEGFKDNLAVNLSVTFLFD